jgi:hypothetical protein
VGGIFLKKFLGLISIFLILFTGVWAAEEIQVVLEQPAFSSAESGKNLKYNLLVNLPEGYNEKFSSFSVTVLMDKNLSVSGTKLVSQEEVKGKVDVRTTSIAGKDQNIVTLNVNDLGAIDDKNINLEINTKVKNNISSGNNLKNSFVLSYVDKKGNSQSDQKNLESSTKTQNGKLKILDVYTNTTEISGVAEKNANVKLDIDSKFYKEVEADNDGNFKFKVNELKEGTVLHFTSTTKGTSATLDYIVKPQEDSYKSDNLVDEKKQSDEDLYKTIKSLYKLSDLVDFAKEVPTVRTTVQNEKRLKAAIASSEYVIVKDEVSSKDIENSSKELLSAIKEVRVPYMNGISKDTFKPDKKMTRAEAASVLKRIIAPEKTVSDFSSFSDIKSDAWYNDDIVFIEKEGLISGFDDGTFRPNDEMTRAQFASLIANYLKLEDNGSGANFSDVKNHWAKKSIDMLSSRGIMNGKSKDKFYPDDKITRAEAATTFNKILDRNINKSFIDKYGVNPFKDLNKDHWAYYQIIEITAN